jgi:hypothetical protein
MHNSFGRNTSPTPTPQTAAIRAGQVVAVKVEQRTNVVQDLLGCLLVIPKTVWKVIRRARVSESTWRNQSIARSSVETRDKHKPTQDSPLGDVLFERMVARYF